MCHEKDSLATFYIQTVISGHSKSGGHNIHRLFRSDNYSIPGYIAGRLSHGRYQYTRNCIIINFFAYNLMHVDYWYIKCYNYF